MVKISNKSIGSIESNESIESIETDESDVPEEFFCPISHMIFLEPVVCSDGHVYEKELITEWLKNSLVSPITRKNITSKELYPSFFFNKKVKEYLQINPGMKKLQYVSNIISIQDVKNNPSILKTYSKEQIKFFIEIIYHLKKQIEIKEIFEKFMKNDSIVKHIIDTVGNDAQFQTTTTGKRNLMHIVCRYANLQMVRYMVERGADTGLFSYRGWKPFHFLCRNNTFESIKYFIDRFNENELQKMIKEKTLDGYTPLNLLDLNTKISKSERRELNKLLPNGKQMRFLWFW